MKNNQKGFSIVELFMVIIIVGLVGFIGWYVWHSNQAKKTTASTENQTSQPTAASTATKAAEKQYLAIKEWGVKIPLNDLTKNATYHTENGYVYLDVAIDGDTAGDCKNQAAMSRVTADEFKSLSEDEQSTTLNTLAAKIDGTYYTAEGSQASCSDNSAVQDKATAIRSYWLKNVQNLALSN